MYVRKGCLCGRMRQVPLDGKQRLSEQDFSYNSIVFRLSVPFWNSGWQESWRDGKDMNTNHEADPMARASIIVGRHNRAHSPTFIP